MRTQFNRMVTDKIAMFGNELAPVFVHIDDVDRFTRSGETVTRQPADQRYENAYLFGAVCPARGIGAALAMPYADTDAMQRHLDEISRKVRKSDPGR